jgi:hypothetical protein
MGRARLLVLFLGSLGCARPLQAVAVQPNPLLLTPVAEKRPESAKLFIYVGHQDMDVVSKMIMANSARFVVVSKDRLRFHVTVEHKWEEWADLGSWEVWLEDDKGLRHVPDSRDQSKNKNKSDFFDYERRDAQLNQFGDVIRVAPGPGIAFNPEHQDDVSERVTMPSIDRYQGVGDYSFSAKGIFGPQVRKITLVMKRDGTEYRYVWQFQDGPVRLAHHKQGTLGLSGGYMTPGPATGFK